MSRKLFIGARLRRLREQAGLNQAAMAGRLGLSLSYVCQLENNQRPVSAAVLLKLADVFGQELTHFSEDQDKRLLTELQVLLRDRSLVGDGITQTQIVRMVEQVPELAEAFVTLAQRHLHLQEEYGLMLDRFYGDQHPAQLAPLPHEAARDFFNRRNNHIERLDDAAERLAQHWQLMPGERSATVRERLKAEFGIEVLIDSRDGNLRQYEPRRRRLTLSPQLSDGQQVFQMASQLALVAHRADIDHELDEAKLTDEQTRALARQGLAHYFAGALLMPYGEFLAAARALRYDIQALQQRFQVGFESICHRLSTLQRSGARGVPFYLVRVDQAGNISKRQSATGFHFARHGGACPLWHVHEAFTQPGRILTQIAEMPDGTRFFGIARSIERGGGGYRVPRKHLAIGLGCELAHAGELVYADGIDLAASQHVVPIGPGCRVCPRPDCIQRAFPPAGKWLETADLSESLVSYRFSEQDQPNSLQSKA